MYRHQKKKQIGDKHIGLRHTKYEEKNHSASYKLCTKKKGGGGNQVLVLQKGINYKENFKLLLLIIVQTFSL